MKLQPIQNNEIYPTNRSGYITIIDASKQSEIVVKFHDTGWETTTTASCVRSGSIRDHALTNPELLKRDTVVLEGNMSTKEKVLALRKAGYSYSKISDELGILMVTVRSLCN